MVLVTLIFPTIRGGIAEYYQCLLLIDIPQVILMIILVEGGGTGYKVNDRLLFDNTDTRGDGVSATVSTVTGEPVTNLSYVVG